MRKLVLVGVLFLSACATASTTPVSNPNTNIHIDGVLISVGVRKPFVTSIIYRPRSARPEDDFELANRAAETVVGCRGTPVVEQYSSVDSASQPVTIVQIKVAC